MAEVELPDDGLTLGELADLIPQLRRRREPWPGLTAVPQDWGGEPDRVVRVTAVVELADGRKVEIEGSGENLRGRVDVRRVLYQDRYSHIIPTTYATGDSMVTLSVLGDVQGRVRVRDAPEVTHG